MSLQRIEIEVFLQEVIESEEILCPGEELIYGNEIITEAGFYEILVDNGQSCKTLIMLTVNESEEETIEEDKQIMEQLSSYLMGIEYGPSELFDSWETYSDIDLIIVDIPSGFEVDLDESVGSMQINYQEGIEGEYQIIVEFCKQECESNCFELILDLELINDCLNEASLFFPSGFTPNGDGINDYFKISGYDECKDQYQENELIIWNRWGQEVFYEKPYQNKWGGTDKSGEPLSEGTYYFSAILDGTNSVVKTSYVVIIR
jgi:gliding motility-associated-like protein